MQLIILYRVLDLQTNYLSVREQLSESSSQAYDIPLT